MGDGKRSYPVSCYPLCWGRVGGSHPLLEVGMGGSLLFHATLCAGCYFIEADYKWPCEHFEKVSDDQFQAVIKQLLA